MLLGRSVACVFQFEAYQRSAQESNRDSPFYVIAVCLSLVAALPFSDRGEPVNMSRHSQLTAWAATRLLPNIRRHLAQHLVSIRIALLGIGNELCRQLLIPFPWPR